MNGRWLQGALVALILLPVGMVAAFGQELTVRIGHFPNVTHVQALVARNLERHGTSWFAPRLGPDVKIEWYAYNAGPSAMEAIFAGGLDLAYVGPNPALNAYARSGGQEIRVIAGAVIGGSALVARAGEHTSPGLRISAASVSRRPSSETRRMWQRGLGLPPADCGLRRPEATHRSADGE